MFAALLLAWTWPAGFDVQWILWSLAVLLVLLGLIGSVLPVLPGPALIFLASAMQAIWQPDHAPGTLGWVLLCLLLALSVAVDVAAGALGARWFGASAWGVWGSLIGAVVGLAFFPLGLLLGPLLGGFVFERWLGGLKPEQAARSSVGALLGTGLGLLLRLGLALLMVAVVVWAWLD
jgi:uncharacterized protein YqgC (DUF456 family)